MPMPFEEQRPKPNKRIAAIDLGTNSFHAVITDVHPDGTYTIIDSLKEMICLGRDGVGKHMTEADFALGLDAMRKIKRLCDHQNVERIIAYATSAIREAPNGGDFVQLIIDELQIKIHPIPGYKEAELVGYAVQHGLSLGTKPELAVDIGGGSTEFVILNNTELLHLESRKIGVSRMAADFIRKDPVTKGEIAKMEKYYRKRLDQLSVIIRKYDPSVLIGSSGTMQNIASMIAAEKGISTELTLNEFEYSDKDFFAFYKSFIKLDREKRLKKPGLDEKRVDFIIPGLVLVKFLLKTFKIKKIKTSVQALREGIIIEYIRKEINTLKLLDEFPETRRRSVHELCRNFRWKKKHSRQVASLALKLFDATLPIHNLGLRERELLEYASLMHDIGYHISQRRHHKHSLYIIQNSNLKGFTQEEIEIMAHVGRYHRRSTPKKRHAQYMALTEAQRITIRKLSGFLRVADGLDRSHYQNVIGLETENGGDVFRIIITTLADPELEIWGAMRKREMLEELLGKKVEIVSSANGTDWQE